MIPRAVIYTYSRRIHVDVGVEPRWPTHVHRASINSIDCLESIVITSLGTPRPDKFTALSVIRQDCLVLELQDTHVGNQVPSTRAFHQTSKQKIIFAAFKELKRPVHIILMSGISRQITLGDVQNMPVSTNCTPIPIC